MSCFVFTICINNVVHMRSHIFYERCKHISMAQQMQQDVHLQVQRCQIVQHANTIWDRHSNTKSMPNFIARHNTGASTSKNQQSARLKKSLQSPLLSTLFVNNTRLLLHKKTVMLKTPTTTTANSRLSLSSILNDAQTNDTYNLSWNQNPFDM